jgi:hypothetical protein
LIGLEFKFVVIKFKKTLIDPFQRLTVFFLFSLFIMPGSIALAVVEDNSLSLSVSVIPTTSASSLMQKGNLSSIIGGVAQPGEEFKRKIRVRNNGTMLEVVDISVGFANRINQILTPDEARTSAIANWASFSPAAPNLPPNKNIDIDVTIKIPVGTPIGIQEALLYVRAQPAKTAKSQGTQVKSIPRFAIPIFIGVGTSEQIPTTFTLGPTTLTSSPEGWLLNVLVTNTGLTPIAPTGSFKLKAKTGSLSYADSIFFSTPSIQPGESRTASALVPNDVPAGVWMVSANAIQGGVEAKSDSEVTYTKTGVVTPPVPDVIKVGMPIQSLVIGFASLFILILLIFLLRRGLRKDTKRIKIKNKSKTLRSQDSLNSIGIADEVSKLAVLLAQGVISSSEFKAAKAKLFE